MIKQEEIDWGLRKLIREWTNEDGTKYLYDFSRAIRNYLNDNGVMIKVDIDYGGMEKIQFGIHGDAKKKLIHSVTVNGIECVAIEPL